MAKHTIVLSRAMSSDPGKPGGGAVGEIIEVRRGDYTDLYNTLPELKNKFYWRTLDLDDSMANDINMAIVSPRYENGLIVYPKKTAMLNSLNASDKAKLNIRGSIPEKLGGPLTFSSITISED